ncbi:hypothetical protein LEP1GSC051_2333 [Leptospira sp. P2653]|nr:hypothetical protein LEP1GSC051_2333 [Leptospira sp. P2653]
MDRRKYFLGSSRTKKYELSQNANELGEESVERIFPNVKRNKKIKTLSMISIQGRRILNV